MTEDELMLKTGKMVHKAKELKERLTKLENELKVFASSWLKLGHEASRGWTFKIDENCLRFLNASQNMYEIASVPWAHLDPERVKHLFGDIQQTRDELTEAENELRSLGI